MPDSTLKRNSTRRFYSATFRAIRSGSLGSDAADSEPGLALAKLQFALAFAPTAEELTTLAAAESPSPAERSALSALSSLASSVPSRGAMAAASAFASVSRTALVSTIGRLLAHRNRAATVRPPPGDSPVTSVRYGVPDSVATSAATSARRQLLTRFKPVDDGVFRSEGDLHDLLDEYAGLYGLCLCTLDRMEMTPNGTESGELVSSVPLAPGERVSITHREWSTQDKDFEEYIQSASMDSMERSTVGRSDMALSTEAEYQRAKAIGPNDLAAGPFLGVTVGDPMDAGDLLTAAHPDPLQRDPSLASAQLITARASARSIKDHRISFRLASASGTSDEAARQLHNRGTDYVLQLNYYRLMRRWNVRLLRYGARLAFDVVLPDVGSELRLRQEKLKMLDNELAQSFAFGQTVAGITRANWLKLAQDAQVVLKAPPAETTSRQESFLIPASGVPDYFPTHFVFDRIELTDYRVTQATQTFICGDTKLVDFDVLEDDLPPVKGTVDPHGVVLLASAPDGSPLPAPPGAGGSGGHGWGVSAANGTKAFDFIIPSNLVSWIGRTGKLTATYRVMSVQPSSANIRVEGVLTEEALLRWQQQCWTVLRDAALANYQRRREALRQERDALSAQIARDDPQWLRRLEREQVMRGVFRWLIPGFEHGSQAWSNALYETFMSWPARYQDFRSEIDPDALSAATYERVMAYGDIMRFLNEAFEWEYVTWVTYPYFWDVPSLQEQKVYFEHADPTHREFLRASAARVFLTLRPGFENDLLWLIDKGALPAAGSQSPRLSIVAEVHALDAALAGASPGPPADQGGTQIQADWVEYTPTGALQLEAVRVPLATPL